jgi:hypothetical protein
MNLLYENIEMVKISQFIAVCGFLSNIKITNNKKKKIIKKINKKKIVCTKNKITFIFYRR